MGDPSDSFLLVDGNNVIHAWPDLSDLHRRKRGSAHVELIRRLQGLMDFSDHRVVVVFDGTRETRIEERSPGGVQVIYASRGETADDVIERLALKYVSTFRITVATDDVPEQDVVVAAGGEAISTTGLRHWIESADRDRSEWLRRHRRKE